MSDNSGPPKNPQSGDAMAAASSDLDEQSRVQLAHELYMNENLEMAMPDPNSIYGHVKQIVHRLVIRMQFVINLHYVIELKLHFHLYEQKNLWGFYIFRRSF